MIKTPRLLLLLLSLTLPALGMAGDKFAIAADGDQTDTFDVGGSPVELTIQDWSGYIGQWDNRVWENRGFGVNGIKCDFLGQRIYLC